MTDLPQLNLNTRQRKLLHHIAGRKYCITASELAHILEVSAKTIRADIAEINRQLSPFCAAIASIHGKGYLYQAEDRAAIQRLVQRQNTFAVPEDRIKYICFRLCLAEEPIDLYDLADELFVSRSTIFQDIQQVKQKYLQAIPGLRFLREHDTVFIQRNEKCIRTLLTTVLREGWNYNSPSTVFFSYHYIDEAMIDRIRAVVPPILQQNGIHMEDPSMVSLLVSIAVMYKRLITGHFLPARSNFEKHNQQVFDACVAIFAVLEEELDYMFPASEKNEIYLTIIRTKMPERVRVPGEGLSRQFNPFIVSMANQFFGKVEHFFRLDWADDQDLQLAVMHLIWEFQSQNWVYYTQNNIFSEKINLLAECEFAYLFQEIAMDFLGRPLQEVELLYLAQCLSGGLDYHMLLKPECKVRAVLMTQINMATAFALKRKIDAAYGSFMTITDVRPINDQCSYDFSNTDLLLMTADPGLIWNGPPQILRINPCLSFRDYENIGNVIRRKQLNTICDTTDEHLFHLLDQADWQEGMTDTELTHVIEKLYAGLAEKGILTRQHLQHILERDREFPYLCLGGVLYVSTTIPAERTSLAIATLNHRIISKNRKIRTVILAVFSHRDMPLLPRLKHMLYHDPPKLDNLKMAKCKQQFMALYFPEKHIGE